MPESPDRRINPNLLTTTKQLLKSPFLTEAMEGLKQAFPDNQQLRQYMPELARRATSELARRKTSITPKANDLTQQSHAEEEKIRQAKRDIPETEAHLGETFEQKLGPQRKIEPKQKLGPYQREIRPKLDLTKNIK